MPPKSKNASNGQAVNLGFEAILAFLRDTLLPKLLSVEWSVPQHPTKRHV